MSRTVKRIVGIQGPLAMLLTVFSACLLLHGCGSSVKIAPVNPAASTKSAAYGRAVLTFTWPNRPAASRVIPVAANSIRVSVLSSTGAVLSTQLIVRQISGGNTATVTFDRLVVGPCLVKAIAYPSADGTGFAQAQAQTSATVVADQTAHFSLTLASTVTTLTITTPPTALTVGQTATLTATPTDASGNVILISPSTLQWTSSAVSVATVSSTGVVTGVGSGSATITARETESGKSAGFSLNVAAVTPSSLPKAVAFQLNASHSGFTSFGKPLTFPASPTWSVTLAGNAAYSLIADGKVFVLTTNAPNYNGNLLYALDETTGKTIWGPITVPCLYINQGVAYDNGMVFASGEANVGTFSGRLQAFDAATGVVEWTTDLSSLAVGNGAPTAANGIVYLCTDQSVCAVSESTHALLWNEPINGTNDATPTISLDSSGGSTGALADYPCQEYKFAPTTGATLWHDDGPCDGGGGHTGAYANGLYFANDDNQRSIYNAANGAVVGSVSSLVIPAVDAANMYILNTDTLQAVSLATKSTLWGFKGDGGLTSAPIVIDKTVLIASSSGNVYAVNADSGAQIWTGSAGAPVLPTNNVNVDRPLAGLSAGEGYLVVPAGPTVTAWHLVGN